MHEAWTTACGSGQILSGMAGRLRCLAGCIVAASVKGMLWIVLLSLLGAVPAKAEKGKLRERLTPEVLAVVHPGGFDRLGPEEGSPPAIAIYQGDKIVAYVFSTLDIIAAPGYSTTPFDVIAGVDLGGRITGAKVVFHNEPYIVHDVKRQRLLDTFLAQEAGRPIRGAANGLPPDFVAGATVSARAMRAAIVTTAGLVLRARLARPVAAVPTLDVETFSRKSWDALIAAGAVVRRRVTAGDVAAALSEAGASAAKLEVPLGRSGDLYSDFATALFTPAAIGGNLIGILNYEDYKRRMPSDAQAIFVASTGPYNFLGTRYFQDSSGHRFDRLRVVQEGHVFDFGQDDYLWINPYAEGIRGMQDAGLFIVPANSGFDPLKPWRLELLVNGASDPPVTVASASTIMFRTCRRSPASTIRKAPGPACRRAKMRLFRTPRRRTFRRSPLWIDPRTIAPPFPPGWRPGTTARSTSRSWPCCCRC